jgi:hypothetical protein
MNKPKDKRYVKPAMGLFYLKKNDDMVPIAIQLSQQPGESNPIWTPLQDTEWDWIMAKLWLRCADSQYHQVNVISTRNVLLSLLQYDFEWVFLQKMEKCGIY